jgi:phosphinothricin acetyltransferase
MTTADDGVGSIRLAHEGDAEGIAAVYRPYVTDAATSFEIDPPGTAEMARRIEATLAVAPWLVCTGASGEVRGYAYASRHHDRPAYQWSVDVTVYIAARYHRRGMGRALYHTLFSLLRVQGFFTAHAGITLPNAGSVGLHEALGFRPVGVYPAVGWKLGSWRDVGWWHLPLQKRPATPPPPLSPGQAQKLDSWAAVLSSPL